jgi:hypothetical protein
MINILYVNWFLKVNCLNIYYKRIIFYYMVYYINSLLKLIDFF